MNAAKWRRRKVMVMHLVGFSYAAIATLLGISESTARNDVRWIERELERLAALRPLWPEHDGP